MRWPPSRLLTTSGDRCLQAAAEEPAGIKYQSMSQPCYCRIRLVLSGLIVTDASPQSQLSFQFSLLAGAQTSADPSYIYSKPFQMPDFCGMISDDASETHIPAAEYSYTNDSISLYQTKVTPYESKYAKPVQHWSGWPTPMDYMGNSDQQYYKTWQPSWQPYPSKHEIYIGNLLPSLTEAGLHRCLPSRGLEQVKVTTTIWLSLPPVSCRPIRDLLS